jgi:tRNA nucleotidyltransferase (CCA-adding enzyme)
MYDKSAADADKNGTGRWELFSHEADMGVRGIGPTLAKAFEQCALALTAVITDPGRVTDQSSIVIKCHAPDNELLLVDWLNALIYEIATRKMVFGRYHVAIHDGHLQGKAWGEAIDVGKHQPAVETKGATYTTLRVAREHGQWIAQTVIDV